MNRYCFTLRVDPDLLPEYRARHAHVWPEMLRALNDAGWTRYSIFAADDGQLVGYVEAEDLDRAQAAMAATEVNTRWQEQMRKYFVGLDGRTADTAFRLLDKIFDLDEQTAALRGDQTGARA